MKRFKRYLLVPLATLLTLFLTELLALYDVSRTVVIVMLVFVLFGRTSSLYANILSVGLLSLYSFYYFPPYRASLIVISFLFYGVYDALRNRRLRMATEIIENTTNGNLKHLGRIHEAAKEHFNTWRCPEDQRGKEQAFFIADNLGDLRQKVEFWHQEAILKKIVQEEKPIYNEIT